MVPKVKGQVTGNENVNIVFRAYRRSKVDQFTSNQLSQLTAWVFFISMSTAVLSTAVALVL